MILREASKVADLEGRADDLNDEAAKRIVNLLEQLHRQVLADIAAKPELSAGQLGGLRREIESLLTQWRARAIGDLNGFLAQAFDLGDDVFDAELAAANIRLGIVGISDATLKVAQGFSADQITGIVDVARRKINSELQLAALGGRDFTQLMDAIGRNLDGPGVFGSLKTRAEVIARTEVHRIYNLSYQQRGDQSAAMLPGLRKVWRHRAVGKGSRPSKKSKRPGQYTPRPAHLALDGVSIPWGDDFNVDGEKAKGPMDPRLSARNSVSCGCRLTRDLSQVTDSALRVTPTRIS